MFLLIFHITEKISAFTIMVNFKFRWIPNMSSGLRLNKEKKSRVTTIGPIKMMIAISSLTQYYRDQTDQIFYPRASLGWVL